MFTRLRFVCRYCGLVGGCCFKIYVAVLAFCFALWLLRCFLELLGFAIGWWFGDWCFVVNGGLVGLCIVLLMACGCC